MKAVSLNFSHQLIRRQRRRDLVILVLSVVLILVVMTNLREVQQDIAVTTQNRTEFKRSQVVAIASDPRQQRQVQAMVQSLNLPWYELLTALEKIKQQHQDIFLTAIMPDAANKQVILDGEAKTLDNLLAFIDDLNNEVIFRSALPLNQQQVIPSANGMQFTLKLEWRHG